MRRITDKELEFWTGSFEYHLFSLCLNVIEPSILSGLENKRCLNRKSISYSVHANVDRNGTVTIVRKEITCNGNKDVPADVEHAIVEVITNSIRLCGSLPSSCPESIVLQILGNRVGRSDLSACRAECPGVNYHLLFEHLPINQLHTNTQQLFASYGRPRIGVILKSDGSFEVILLHSTGLEDLDQGLLSQITNVCSNSCKPFPHYLLGEPRFCLENSARPRFPSPETFRVFHKENPKPLPSDVLDCQEESISLQCLYEYGIPGYVSAERHTVPSIALDTYPLLLPDIRDGLTPLQRRVIYSLYELRLDPPTKITTATVVRHTFNCYHRQFPSPIYKAILHLLHPKVCRYPLLESTGNIGDLDTQASGPAFTKIAFNDMAMQGLGDVEHDCVDFVDTLDGTTKEPLLLPTRLPLLLMNGIGHSIFCNGSQPRVLPHNLTELCNAILKKIDSPNLSSSELLQFCQGPDFPTGGTIVNGSDLKSIYETGTGIVRLRGTAAETEIHSSVRKKRRAILVTNLPFLIGPESFTNNVASLVKDERLIGISDVVDETDTHGIRVLIELKSDANATTVLEDLFRLTQLQVEIPVNMVAMIPDKYFVSQPQYMERTVGLAELIQEFIDHQLVLVKRRMRFHLCNSYLLQPETQRLAKSKVVDDLISDEPDAIRMLMKEFGICQEMAQAVVAYNTAGPDLLYRLETAQKSVEPYGDSKEAVKAYEVILAKPERVLQIVKDQVEALRDKHGDERRTEIVNN